MFGLSTELITKGKLATVKEIRVLTFGALALCHSGLAPMTKVLRSKRRHSNLFTVANLPLVINSVDKPSIRSYSSVPATGESI